MKRFVLLAAVALTGSVLLSACGKKEEAPPAEPMPVMAKPVPPAPTPAPPAVKEAPKTLVDLVATAKSGVEKAMALTKDGKYQEALALLQEKAVEVQGNPEAKKLIDEAVAKIKQMMADAASKAATEKVGEAAGKALGDLGK